MPRSTTGRFFKWFVSCRAPFALGCIVLLSLTALPQPANAQRTWNANVGAETRDQAGQADAFLPNEIWINAGDSIQWTWRPKNEPHTLTLLAPEIAIFPTPPPPIGPPAGPPFVFSNICPSPNPYEGGTATYDGTACVSSDVLNGSVAPSTFKVTFPNAGNYKFACLLHPNMNGTVHVLDKTASLPYLQWDYDRKALDQAADILADTYKIAEEVRDYAPNKHEVLMEGEMRATGGGRQYLAVVRFLPQTIYVHKGDTVEFTNADPTEPHTVTSGKSDTLTNDMALVGVGATQDGALAAVVNTAGDFGNTTPTTGVNSGFLQAAGEDAAGRAQSVPGTTRIRVQFNVAGTFYYHCALHDIDGMNGSVVVR